MSKKHKQRFQRPGESGPVGGDENEADVIEDSSDDTDSDAAAPADATEEPKSTHHFVVQAAFGGKVHQEGDLIELTAAEAKELGDLVAPGKAPEKPTPEVVRKREAGRYRVTPECGTLYCSAPTADGGVKKYHKPGDELDLTRAQARDLGAAVEPVV